MPTHHWNTSVQTFIHRKFFHVSSTISLSSISCFFYVGQFYHTRWESKFIMYILESHNTHTVSNHSIQEISRVTHLVCNPFVWRRCNSLRKVGALTFYTAVLHLGTFFPQKWSTNYNLEFRDFNTKIFCNFHVSFKTVSKVWKQHVKHRKFWKKTADLNINL